MGAPGWVHRVAGARSSRPTASAGSATLPPDGSGREPVFCWRNHDDESGVRAARGAVTVVVAGNSGPSGDNPGDTRGPPERPPATWRRSATLRDGIVSWNQ